MAWSDAARRAAAEARKRKAVMNAKNKLQQKAMAAFSPSAKMTPESAVKAFSPSIHKQMIGARAYRLIDPGFAATMNPGQRALSGFPTKPLSAAQKDAAYARKQRKAGKSSIFSGMLFEKKLKGFER